MGVPEKGGQERDSLELEVDEYLKNEAKQNRKKTRNQLALTPQQHASEAETGPVF